MQHEATQALRQTFPPPTPMPHAPPCATGDVYQGSGLASAALAQPLISDIIISPHASALFFHAVQYLH